MAKIAEGLLALSALTGLTIVTLQQLIQKGTLSRILGYFAPPKADLERQAPIETESESDVPLSPAWIKAFESKSGIFSDHARGEVVLKVWPQGGPQLMSPIPEHLRPPHILITPLPEQQGIGILITPQPTPLPPLPGYSPIPENLKGPCTLITPLPEQQGIGILSTPIPSGAALTTGVLLNETAKKGVRTTPLHQIPEKNLCKKGKLDAIMTSKNVLFQEMGWISTTFPKNIQRNK